MFKLQSYIAPILLSYVDKYIKNFKLEDSQVSLWGGDASFQNLDLRLEVLEQELQSPFSFISGHIRELLIHVPWTKLTSEPITITINTIECVLKLREAGSASSSESPSHNRKFIANKQQVEAPPNYVQLLINKIVNNIRIYCNNLILKYVEEDIVLSMNVKHLKFESCNDKWEAAYIDLSPSQVVMRKVIGVNDLTVCLDKRNASGKIDVYQEPMLYRCSMTMHFLTSYHAATVKKSSLMRLDVYCNNMEFSMTEQQVPMALRLILLLNALHQKQLKPTSDTPDGATDPADLKEGVDADETWTGWAWSYVSSVLPTQWEDESEQEQFLNQSGHVIQLGYYVDNASLTFKVSESSDKGYYSQKKIRYFPLLTLQLQGIYSEVQSVGPKWTNVSFGVSEVVMGAVGPCSCSQPESSDDFYLTIGSKSSSHKTDSLFDAEAAENKGQWRNYNTDWDFHLDSLTEEVMLERTAAFAMDYVYQMEVPDDMTSEALSEIGTNLEYSNLAEKSSLRICFGGVKIVFCSGLLHRMESLRVAAASYDYTPYYVEKSDPSIADLLPPSEEDFDALNEFIPSRAVKVTFFKPVIELQLMDHPFFQPVKGNLIKRSKKLSTVAQPPLQSQKLPKLTFECARIQMTALNPMYINRLIHTTCQLPEPPKHMFEACFSKTDVRVVGLCSRLVLKPTNHTTILVPFNLTYQSKNVLKSQYWIHPDIPHSEVVFRSENLTFNGTKAKLMVVHNIIRSILNNCDTEKTVTSTSLLFDAAKDYGMPYIEFCLESVKFTKVITNSTVALDASVGAIKAFIFEPIDNSALKDRHSIFPSDIQQVLFLSGPETKSIEPKLSAKMVEDQPLFTLTVQYPLKPELQTHPPLLIFNLQEIKVCVDPLLCKWFLYYPVDIVTKPETIDSVRGKSYSETYGTISENSRRVGAQIESVHSSSDRELLMLTGPKLAKVPEGETVDERIYGFLKTWYVVWKGMVFGGHVSQCTIYFPTASISALGSRGMDEAIREATNRGHLPNVMIVTLPFATITSAQKQNVFKHLNQLPVKLPDNIWTSDKSSFPWTMSISDLNCYTIQHGKKFVFLKPVSLSATVGLSTKSDTNSDNMGHLGVYVHIDMTPIVVSTSETQMLLFGSILCGLAEISAKMRPDKVVEVQKFEMLPPINSPSISPTVRDNTIDDTSENTLPASETKSEGETEAVKLTAWIQWTITRFSMELVSDDFSSKDPDKSQLKLLVDVEDIVSSLDYQHVYLKLKNKIGSVSIQHFKRTPGKTWQPGPFSGVIMRLREDVPGEKKPEDGGFISMTVTRASCQHTHNLWGALQKNKKDDKRLMSSSRYITEIVINIQPIDFVIPVKTLMNFYLTAAPLLQVSAVKQPETPTRKSQWFNQLLPLAYLECQDVRVIVPSSELTRSRAFHDVFVLQVKKIALSPSVVNPICRTPIRPDIYRQAAQARILNIPGSDLEDRQYQLDVVEMSTCTGSWEDLDHVLNMRNVALTANENPALEWNNLEKGQFSIIPNLNLQQVTEKFDISIVAAPAMLYKNDIVICGTSFEINFVSDIVLQLSLNQISLLSALADEFSFSHNGQLKRPDIIFPYLKFDKYSTFSDDIEIEMTEFYKDSGIDTSDIRSVLSSKSQPQAFVKKVAKTATAPGQVTCEVPSDVLFTGGKITCCLYQLYLAQSATSSRKGKVKKNVRIVEEDRDYEASEEESIDVANKSHRKYIPLFFVFVAQPNAYFSSQQYSSRAQISCFDFSVKLNAPEATSISTIPTSQDFPINLVETRSGNPDLITGIPPAFLTLKHSKEVGKSSNYALELSRPTKLIFSTLKLLSLMSLKARLVQSFGIKPSKVTPPIDDRSSFRRLKDTLRGIDNIEVKTDQIVVVVETDQGTQASLTVAKIRSYVSSGDRPEKVCNISNLRCVSLSITHDKVTRVLLNPWTISVEISAFLESWQSCDSEPQIHLGIDSDCVMLDVSSEQIRFVQNVAKELTEFAASLSLGDASNVTVSAKIPVVEKDQHYKDDLRAGAFQFIDANTEELPLPYQVMFRNDQISAMAWRYPHPRALTKVRVFPVPLETSIDTQKHRIACYLQYWSNYQNCYVSYVKFFLSESEVCYLDLPKTEPRRAVACVWRVVLSGVDETGVEASDIKISPRALAACMRIDSYFNKSLVPNLTVSVRGSKIDVALHTSFNKKSAQLPENLAGYSSDLPIPDAHSFFKLTWENLLLNVASWNSGMLSVDFSSITKCSVLDYTFLTETTLLEPFSSKIELNLSQKLCCSFVSNQVQLKFGPGIAHTLAVNAQMWAQNLTDSDTFVVFTRYVVCNDTNGSLRFGQASTDEDILLPSKSFHLYGWRSQKHKQKLKVALEEKSWVWSQAFYVDQDGTHVVPISPESNLSIMVKVATSATQKIITISGQFVIANMLLEHFEFKIVPNAKDDRESRKSPTHVLAGKTITPSMFLDFKATHFLRLRFFGLEAAWTGDIPLKEHTKGAQPWLVKVPLQERGQFLSIWCRIVVQDYPKGKKILAMLWPLFTVKSNLPVASNIHIETPSLNVHLDSVVGGKGELQQLYCPGTIDHSHQLTFKLDDGTSISHAYIPLNYSLVDQQQFFKRNDKENVDEILTSLKNYDSTKWPYFGEDLEDINWVVDEQPQTTVQVRYRNACPFSSALLVELLPWCLMVNTFGCTISLLANVTELCRIPQNGIVAPPKLDETFHLGIDTGSGWHYSGPLQLAKSDWSQTFYMPTISGTLPLEGSIKAAVKCGSHVCMVCMTSSIVDEIRLLKVSSTHVFTNSLVTQIQMVCLAVPEGDNVFDIPNNIDDYAFAVAPHSDKSNSGISILRWYCVDKNCDSSTDYVLYVAFSLHSKHGWSCPVKVDKGLMRKSLAVNSDKQSVPLVLTSQEHKGQIYLSLFHDDRPQILLENNSDIALFCGQSLSDGIADESKHFIWFNRIDCNKRVYYTMPFVSEKFPELPQTCFAEKIVFACDGIGEPEWSVPISITYDLEQFLRIPGCGDIKLVVKATSYTTLLSIEPVSQVEISAIDIRGRLSLHEMESKEVAPKRSYSHNSIEELMQRSSAESSRSDLNFANNLYKSLFVPTIPLGDDFVEIFAFVRSFSVVLFSDQDAETEGHNVASFTFDNIGLELVQDKLTNCKLTVTDIQFDNQLYMKESYDFPVVIVSQETKSRQIHNVMSVSAKNLVNDARNDSLLFVELNLETWRDSMRHNNVTGVKDVKVTLNPISCYVEDLYITRLSEYFKTLLPSKVLVGAKKRGNGISVSVKVPVIVYWQSQLLAKPVNVRNITIEPLSLLLSVHCSLKMYIALDQSPLQFARFERRRLLTTPYRLGHAMTMHYLSGAIFGAGWVVSSLELLGSPSGLARAMGTGLRDFVSLPYRGLVQGPWAFLIGVTHGSASLMKHVTAGTLQSVTKLASSVARNLDRLTLDGEHLKRTEEQRRRKPQGLTQGFMQGLTGLGISLLGAVGGIAHHPLQSLMSDQASPRSLAAGVGLGLVGVFTKPLSGAAELVALTGQGLLQGAGWNSLPQPRLTELPTTASDEVNSALKYKWKLLSSITNSNLLFITEATVVTDLKYEAICLILTSDAVIIVDTDEDVVKRIVSLSQVQVRTTSDPTLLSFKVITPVISAIKIEDECVVEMDPACRARVADYVRSTASLLQLSEGRDPETSALSIQDADCNELLSFYVNPLVKNYFVCLLATAKQQCHNNYSYPVV